MSRLPQQLRFVDGPGPRAKQIQRAKWDSHKDELCSLYQSMTLEDLMSHMRNRHGFEPSSRQIIYQFEKWGIRKYNTGGTRPLPHQAESGTRAAPSGVTTPRWTPSSPVSRPAPPSKRSQSNVSSLSSRGFHSSTTRPKGPPKKRQRIMDSIAERGHGLGVAGMAAHLQRRNSTSPRPPSAVRQLASIGLQLSSAAQPNSIQSTSVPSSGSSIGTLHAKEPSTPLPSNTPALAEGGDWLINDDQYGIGRSSLDGLDDVQATSILVPKSVESGSRRNFSSNRPTHTFSREELVDVKAAAHFLRSLGFDNDAFELFTMLLQQVKEQSLAPSSTALIDCARSASCPSQVEIARNELFKLLNEPRESLTDVEHFLFRMLLAETYKRSDDKQNEGFLSDTSIGCELANDKMLDRLPDDSRSYDILTYHYVNKCTEYLKTLDADSRDEGTTLVDKEHLQIRVLERIPGPFELRYGSMRNSCLRSCLDWCYSTLQATVTLPEAWKQLQSIDRHYMYWTDHIGLYCALWEHWQSQRRDCQGEELDIWMLDTETRMGLSPAELLSTVCGMIMSAAPPRHLSGVNFVVMRARSGAQALSRLADKELGCRFLDTYSLLSTLLGSAPQRQYRDAVAFFVAMINSTRERDAFEDKARAFARDFIEQALNVVLPDAPPDVRTLGRQNSRRLSFYLSDQARSSMESLASAIHPTLAPSLQSSELSAMSRLRDQIQNAARSLNGGSTASVDATTLTSQSHTSLPTVNELSQTMRRSFSISSREQVGDAALDAIVAASLGLYNYLSRNESESSLLL